MKKSKVLSRNENVIYVDFKKDTQQCDLCGTKFDITGREQKGYFCNGVGGDHPELKTNLAPNKDSRLV